MFKYRKGNSDVAFFVGFFAVLFLLWWVNGGAQKGGVNKSASVVSVPKTSAPSVSVPRSGGTATKNSSATQPGYNKEGEPLSPYQGKVFISSLGTAKAAFDPDLEFISLRAAKGNKEPVSITGWTLLNGRNRNTVAYGISQQKGVANQAYIPEGRSVYLISGYDMLQPIRLSANQEAVVFSGRAPYFSNYRSSFKTNICLGYLQDEDTKFYPGLRTKCPDPEIEPGIEFLDDECRRFIVRMSSCHDPRVRNYTIESDGDRRDIPSVDNVPKLSSSCRNFLESHYSYRGCVANHLNDKNFYGDQWRVYLNRPWEMWVKGGEVVSLFDDKGLLVDRKSY